MSSKHTNTKKKMASLGLKKTKNGDYTYIDQEDKNSQFTVVKSNRKDK